MWFLLHRFDREGSVKRIFIIFIFRYILYYWLLWKNSLIIWILNKDGTLFVQIQCLKFRRKYCIFFENFFTVDISIIKYLSWVKTKGSEDRISSFSFFVLHSSISILFARITISIGSNGLSLFPYDKFAIPFDLQWLIKRNIIGCQ